MRFPSSAAMLFPAALLAACASGPVAAPASCPACAMPKAAPAFNRPEGRLDTAAIEAASGLKGTFDEKENAFKVSQPRKDVPILVEGRKMEPFMGFTSWATFAPGKAAPAMVGGDLVLFEDEVDAAMDALFAHGLRVTALHNHFFHTKPGVYFMHIGGEGDPAKLAGGVKAALDAVADKRKRAGLPGESFGGPAVPAENAVSAAPLDAVLGVKGQSKDGMYKAVWGRAVTMACGCSAGSQMGVNTWAAFAGNDGAACVAGDFITFAGELQPVLAALRQNGIHIVAIHSHMEGENPKAVFLHYWGKGKAADLARGVKAALDAQAQVGK